MPCCRTDSLPVARSLDRVHEFVTQVTGKAPSDDEIADALGRYFVLKEIADHIRMCRGQSED